jgi:hypothetical protein
MVTVLGVMISQMDTNAIAAAIQAEITRLQSALSILTGGTPIKRRGRPPGSGVKRVGAVAEPAAKTAKTKWTPAQREAARRRAKSMWAKRKKTAKKAA